MKYRILIIFCFIIVALLFICSSSKDIPEENESEQIWGIDISHHQGKIDWDAFKLSKPHFVFMKATEGSTHTDTRYDMYYREFRKMDIPVGTYHFFSYNSTGKEQARHFLKVAKYNKGDLPLVLDAEFKNGMPNEIAVTKELLSFITEVKNQSGIVPIIYCEADYYIKFLQNKIKEPHHLWISDFFREPKLDWLIWQQTDQYKQVGIRGTVDYNVFEGGKDELIAITKGSNKKN